MLQGTARSWTRLHEHLALFAAFKLEVDARRRTVAEQRLKQPERPTPPTGSSTTRTGPTRAGERAATAEGCRPAGI
ncbi:hypothetical protein ACH4VX_34300 [Streptomyces sp. NPDC020731]|uniref:hypothetical protein n=1 Tax=Streptomyces sp. NPDC020731 TaxID=3365085 RepID=UPI003798F024